MFPVQGAQRERKGTGVPPGLQIRCRVLKPSWVGSIPTRSRQRSVGAAVIAVSFTLLVICSDSLGYNYHDRHGHNYIYMEALGDDSYDSHEFAPVIWDVRDAFFQLRDYYWSYGWDGDVGCDSAYRAMDLLFEEAYDHGVDFVTLRSEILRMTDDDLRRGPEAGQHFIELARIAAEDSLRVIAGGLRTSLSENARNDLVVAYLHAYLEGDAGCPDALTGIFGFDEPDARFEGPGWDSSMHIWPWFWLVRDYAMECRFPLSGDIIPFGTFLDRWRTGNGESFYFEETIPLFCAELELPIFDRYPCTFTSIKDREFPDRIRFEDVIGATDLFPSIDADYGAYASRDELFSVDSEGYFKVLEFTDVTSGTDALGMEEVFTSRLRPSLRSDPLWAASDWRATDIGDRSEGEHRLNGAVVFIDPDENDASTVFLHDGSGPVLIEDQLDLPGTGFREVLSVCVGERNYHVEHPDRAGRRGSLIGHDELRILVCAGYVSSDEETIGAWLFGWNDGEGRLEPVSDAEGLRLDISPSGVIWGVFWPSNGYWDGRYSDIQSGFLVHGEERYQVVYENPADGEWSVSQVFDGPPLDEGTTFIARRTMRFPSFTSGMDYICRLEPGSEDRLARFEFVSGAGRDPGDGLGSPMLSEEFDLPHGFEFEDISGACCWRPLRYIYDEALLLSLRSGNDRSEIYSSLGSLNFNAGDGMSIALDDRPLALIQTAEPPFLATPRVYSVRRPYRTPLIADPDPPGNPFRVLMPQSDIAVENTLDLFREQSTALDRMFELGIMGTEIDNCLIPNLRCDGRRQDGQLSYYPPEEKLLYLMVGAIVHGCRGIHLRALDLSLMCGNGGSDALDGLYRCPSLLLDWGPGTDEGNVDVLARVHGVVRTLTGENASTPDFMASLIDDDYTAMDTEAAVNAVYLRGEWTSAPESDCLNFLALEHGPSGDILLMAVADPNGEAESILFPGRLSSDYEMVPIIGEEACPGPGGSEELSICFTGMPPYTASLYLLQRKN